MGKSRLSKGVQDKLCEHFVAGTTARCAAELVGIYRNTQPRIFIKDFVRLSPLNVSRNLTKSLIMKQR